MSVFYAVEDQLSGSVAKRLIHDCLGEEVIVRELGKSSGGFGYIKRNLRKYVDLSQRESVTIFTGLDNKDCAPTLRAEWLRSQKIEEPLPSRMAFCIAVREVESWLLSDRNNIAEFLGVSSGRIDRDVEENVLNPKEYLIELVKRARKSEIRYDLLPHPRSEAIVGFGYNDRLSEFARERWDPAEAADSCSSLRRAIERIREIRP